MKERRHWEDTGRYLSVCWKRGYLQCTEGAVQYQVYLPANASHLHGIDFLSYLDAAYTDRSVPLLYEGQAYSFQGARGLISFREGAFAKAEIFQDANH